MDRPETRPGWEGRLAPRAVLAGVACAFLACCMAGERLSRANPFVGFERFGRLLTAECLFYPTARQVRALGRDALPLDKVAVVVGGNSILHGVAQTSQGLWTKALQAELGDRFRVLNLGIPGVLPNEFGATAAEILSRDHPRLLFLSSVSSAGLPTSPDGVTYRYFFWDARCRGLLPEDAEREHWLGVACEARKDDAEFAELRRQLGLDRYTYSRDLWSRLTYTRFGTVWAPVVQAATWGGHPRPFWGARRRCELPERAQPPLAARYPAELDAHEMAVVRTWSAQGPLFTGEPAPVPTWLRGCVPAPYRGRTLLLVLHDSPHYVGRLTAAEQARYQEVQRLAVAGLERAGFAALEAGRGYTAVDFYDRCHLSEDGGRRLAAEVAPKLRRLARDLGYTE